MTPNESPAALLPDDVLPCDVQVAPRTIIRRGCKVSTLLHCLALRVGRRDIGPLLPLKPAPVASESRGSVPDGFVLVPKTPTTAMVNAAAKSHEGQFYLPISLWESMLAAAPTPPAVASGELAEKIPSRFFYEAALQLSRKNAASMSRDEFYQACEQRARQLARSAAAKGEG